MLTEKPKKLIKPNQNNTTMMVHARPPFMVDAQHVNGHRLPG